MHVVCAICARLPSQLQRSLKNRPQLLSSCEFRGLCYHLCYHPRIPLGTETQIQNGLIEFCSPTVPPCDPGYLSVLLTPSFHPACCGFSRSQLFLEDCHLVPRHCQVFCVQQLLWLVPQRRHLTVGSGHSVSQANLLQTFPILLVHKTTCSLYLHTFTSFL